MNSGLPADCAGDQIALDKYLRELRDDGFEIDPMAIVDNSSYRWLAKIMGLSGWCGVTPIVIEFCGLGKIGDSSF